MSNSEYEKITPADIEINAGKSAPDDHMAEPAAPLGSEERRQLEAYQKRNSRVLWGIFAILLCFALAVVFVLPRYITPPAPGTVSVQQDASGEPPSGGLTTPVSPYEEAQRMERRQEAQNILSEFLELQNTLEDKRVQDWAASDFNAAVEHARAGDQAYREQQFAQARDHYQQGLDLLREVDGRSDSVFNALLEEGRQSIADGEPMASRRSLELALAIKPASEEADRALARAQVLDQVLAKLEEGRTLHDNNRFEEARARYREALEIDGEHQGAARALEQVNNDILARDFSNAMSRGYTALEQGAPEQARESFQQALSLKPDSGEAQAALEQAQDRITSNAIGRHLASAGEHEEAERWQQALEQYNKALEIDSNVVAAVEGREKAESRLNLDNFLVNTIENPLRLAEEPVYQETRQIYNSARRIPDPGPRLNGQLQEVAGLLQKAREPVAVTLKSDGQTDVTLRSHGALGQFSSQTLELTPGSYTAVGVREGYRDVRREFVVPFDGQPPTVTVVCEEEIL